MLVDHRESHLSWGGIRDTGSRGIETDLTRRGGNLWISILQSRFQDRSGNSGHGRRYRSINFSSSATELVEERQQEYIWFPSIFFPVCGVD